MRLKVVTYSEKIFVPLKKERTEVYEIHFLFKQHLTINVKEIYFDMDGHLKASC